jgi:hypothetical protein
MKYRDGIFATVAIALTSFALAGVVYTDVYSQTAKAEVRGVRALTEVASGDALACADASLMSADSADLARTVRQ